MKVFDEITNKDIIIKGIDVEKELWQLRKEYIKQGIWTDIKLNSLNKPCIVKI